MNSKAGFTLVELLIVLVCLAALAALLFPVLGRVREKSRMATCSSHLRQIAAGAQMYMQDHDEALPPHAHATVDFADPTAADWQSNLLHAMLPYIKDKQVLFCPSVPVSHSAYAPTSLSDTSYLGNSVVVGRRAPSVPNPSEVILMHEFPYRTNSFYCNPFWDVQAGNFRINGGYANAETEEAFDFPKNVHYAGENVLFCDGHVKWRSANSLQRGEFGLKPDGPFYNRTPPTQSLYEAAF